MLKKLNISLFISLFIFLTSLTAIAGPGMPKELRSEFTQYPGSTVIHTIASGGMTQAILHCGKATMDTVFDYYKKKISLSGWDVSMEIKSSDTYQLMTTKNGRDGMIAVTGENGETSVVLSISQ